MSNGASRAEYTVRVERRKLTTGDGTLVETSHLVSYPTTTSWSSEHGTVEFGSEQFVGAAVERHNGQITAHIGPKRLGNFPTAQAGVEAVIDFSRAEIETNRATRP